MEKILKKKAPNLVAPTSWVGKVGGVIEANYTTQDPKVKGYY